MKKLLVIMALVLVGAWCATPGAFAQAEGGGDTPAAEAGSGSESGNSNSSAGSSGSSGGGFVDVVKSGGFMGILLWIFLFLGVVACVYFIVDCAINVRISRIMPPQLVGSVTEAMEQGDVFKALEACEQWPGPMANILSAGFSHVEEGYEVIQESIASSAELESEQLMQGISYLSVVGSLAPMLGLLGTVQGMIFAFSSLATEAGATQTAMLALNISQALYTTAAGLSTALPAVACFFIFRNKANKIILRMEGITIDLIKDRRTVEVVEE